MSERSDNLSRRQILAGLAFAAAGTGATAGPAIPGIAAQPRDQTAEVLRVGPDKEYPSLTAAGDRLQKKWTGDGGRPLEHPEPAHVVISPAPAGYYVNDSGSHSRRWATLNGWPPYEGILFGPVVVEGEPGKPAPDLVTDGYGDGVLYYQTGLFSTNGWNAVFRNLYFAGFRRQDGGGNYAAVRLGSQEGRFSQVLFEDVEIDGCDNGIMGGEPGLSLVLRRVHLHDNGNGTGRCHNLYMSGGDSLVVEDLLSTRCTIGHLLKSRAAQTKIRNTRLLGLGGMESACLDVPDGGVLDIDGLVCEKSPVSDASWVIHYSGENQDVPNGVPFHVPSSILIRNLTMIAPQRLERHGGWPILGFVNQSGLGPAQSGAGSFTVKSDAVGVQVYGLTHAQAGLPNVTMLPAPPRLDIKSPTTA